MYQDSGVAMGLKVHLTPDAIRGIAPYVFQRVGWDIMVQLEGLSRATLAGSELS